jgi:hypothetical protein
MAEVFDKVKKQINRQTRESVGSMKIETEATTFVNQPVPGRVGTDPAVTWDKVWYSRNRGDYFPLDPFAFNDPLAPKTTQMMYTDVGNFKDRASTAYYNARYSGYAGISGGGTITFRIVAQGSVTVYLNQEIVHSSGTTAAYPVDITVAISDRSLVQIYWYATNEGATFDLSGNISRFLTLWEQSDVTPFFRPVEWFPEDAVRVNQYGGGGMIPTATVTLKWWFGSPGENEGEGSAASQDLGGFGLWQIDFQEIGEIDVIGDSISVPGYYPNIRYLRINNIVYSPLYVQSANAETNTTVFTFEAHGLTDVDDGTPVEIGLMKLIRNMPISDLGGFKTVYQTNDTDVTWGVTYYYLIDSYDTSPNLNRGGLTETIQMVTAGDITPPPIPYNLTGTRTAVDAVTLEWDQDNLEDVDHWAIYTDFDSSPYSAVIQSGNDGRLALNSTSDYGTYEFYHKLIAYPNGVLITIENDSTNDKVARLAISINGSVLQCNEPIPMADATDVTIRYLNIWTGASNNEPVTPRPPTSTDITAIDATDPSRSGEISVVT